MRNERVDSRMKTIARNLCLRVADAQGPRGGAVVLRDRGQDRGSDAGPAERGGGAGVQVAREGPRVRGALGEFSRAF